MIDVNDITAKLAQLPDAALQQYAQMHKGDPYMVSLAISESNRRKAVRQAAQPQGMAPQGSVVDQAISGIAALPAQNMQDVGMADGGIVAFAGGDAVSRPYSNSEERREYERLIAPNPMFDIPLSAREIRQARRYPVTEPDPMLFDMVPTTDLDERMRYAPPPEVKPDTLKDDKAKPKEDLTPEDVARIRSSLRVSSPASVSAPSVTDVVKMQQQILREMSPENQKRENALRGDYANIEQQGLEALRDVQKEYENKLPQGLAYEEREKRLRAEEEREPEEQERNIKMALVDAGLAMMAGTSPYAMTNIGQGAAQGVKAYRQGINDLKKAAEKRDDLMGTIEQARRAEAEGRAKEAAGFRSKEAELRIGIAKDQRSAVQKLYDVDQRTASNILNQAVDLQQTAMTVNASLEAALARTQGKTGPERLSLLKTYVDALDKQIKEYEAFEKIDPKSPKAKEISTLRAQQAEATAEMRSLLGFAPIPTGPAAIQVPPGFSKPK